VRLDQNAQLASLANDLGTVASVDIELDDDRDDHARARLMYTARPLGIFGDTLRPPELEVGRVLRLLAAKRRLTIERDELDGKRVLCLLPSRVHVSVELRGAWSRLAYELMRP
jgi:hypothetical protein